jgi:hypothetical protein
MELSGILGLGSGRGCEGFIVRAQTSWRRPRDSSASCRITSITWVASMAREHAHSVAVAPADHAIAVVLDLMRPSRAVRHDACERWQGGCYEAGRVQAAIVVRYSRSALLRRRTGRRRICSSPEYESQTEVLKCCPHWSARPPAPTERMTHRAYPVYGACDPSNVAIPALLNAISRQLLCDVGLDRLRRRHVGIGVRTVALLQLRQATTVE